MCVRKGEEGEDEEKMNLYFSRNEFYLGILLSFGLKKIVEIVCCGYGEEEEEERDIEMIWIVRRRKGDKGSYLIYQFYLLFNCLFVCLLINKLTSQLYIIYKMTHSW